MRSKKILLLSSITILALGYFVFSKWSNARTSKISDSLNSAAHSPDKVQRKVAAEPKAKWAQKRARESAAEDTTVETSGAIDPLSNPNLPEIRKRNETENSLLATLKTEKREPLALQIVGGGSWSVFSDLQVSQGEGSGSLFSMGPYHVFRKGDGTARSATMRLVYDENQKNLAVLTGRVVVKVKDGLDVDRIAREYDLKLDTVSAEIRTAYLNTTHLVSTSGAPLVDLNSTLKNDGRVERFYFELVKTSWARN